MDASSNILTMFELNGRRGPTNCVTADAFNVVVRFLFMTIDELYSRWVHVGKGISHRRSIQHSRQVPHRKQTTLASTKMVPFGEIAWFRESISGTMLRQHLTRRENRGVVSCQRSHQVVELHLSQFHTTLRRRLDERQQQTKVSLHHWNIWNKCVCVCLCTVLCNKVRGHWELLLPRQHLSRSNRTKTSVCAPVRPTSRAFGPTTANCFLREGC